MIQKFAIEETIPILHDCQIKTIVVEHDHMVFTFEDELYQHEAIQQIHPGAKSLIMTFHLTRFTGMEEYRLYVRKASKRRENYKRIKKETLMKLPEYKPGLVYLYHYVGAREMILHLCTNQNYVLYVCADEVEINWIESQQFMA